MSDKKKVLDHYPSKYSEIALAVGAGGIAELECATPSEAISVAFSFNSWRKSLRDHVEAGKGTEGQVSILASAENVVASTKRTSKTVRFIFRDTTARNMLLEKTRFLKPGESA